VVRVIDGATLEIAKPYGHAERAYLTALRDRLSLIPGVTVTWPGDLFEADLLAWLNRNS
jgi:hypothetical protein